jgi:hypothetical protein
MTTYISDQLRNYGTAVTVGVFIGASVTSGILIGVAGLVAARSEQLAALTAGATALLRQAAGVATQPAGPTGATEEETKGDRGDVAHTNAALPGSGEEDGVEGGVEFTLTHHSEQEISLEKRVAKLEQLVNDILPLVQE